MMRYPQQIGLPVPNHAPTATGYTPPAATFDKMRQMQSASVEPFNRDVQNVGDAAYKEGWRAWHQGAWLPFYQKYAGPGSSSLTRFGTNFYSDEVAARAEAFRQQLQSFYETYPRQRTAAGQPVPPLTGAPPVLGGLPARPGLASRVPLWAWGLGLAAAGGFGYLVYLRVKELRAKRTALETKVLPKLIGKDLAEAAAARDVRRGSAGQRVSGSARRGSRA